MAAKERKPIPAESDKRDKQPKKTRRQGVTSSDWPVSGRVNGDGSITPPKPSINGTVDFDKRGGVFIVS